MCASLLEYVLVAVMSISVFRVFLVLTPVQSYECRSSDMHCKCQSAGVSLKRGNNHTVMFVQTKISLKGVTNRR